MDLAPAAGREDVLVDVVQVPATCVRDTAVAWPL